MSRFYIYNLIGWLVVAMGFFVILYAVVRAINGGAV